MFSVDAEVASTIYIRLMEDELSKGGDAKDDNGEHGRGWFRGLLSIMEEFKEKRQSSMYLPKIGGSNHLL